MDGAVFGLVVNGVPRRVARQAETSLLDVLREDLELLGTRTGCLEGDCGACTVLLDGNPVQACDTPLWSVAGHRVETIEGLSLTAVREAFLAEQAAQCGYCTNGIIMTVAGLLGRTPPATRAEIVAMLDERHICRCGAQARILRAVDRALGEAR
jgi:nicotinate dehydrogenase subunit A